jgi:hypothetical protein
MPAVTVQFHMLFDELTDFIADAMRDHSLAVELERFFPTTTRVVTTPADLPAEITRFGHVDRIWLLCKPARARTYERFNLSVGRLKSNRLEQSHLGAGTDKPDAFKILKQIAHQLKKRTAAGVWVIGCTGSVGFMKAFRVSPATADAARTGKVELTGLGFTQSFRVDPPDDWRAPPPVVPGRGRPKRGT